MARRLGQSFDVVLTAAQRNAPWAYERLWTSFAPSVASYLRLRGVADPEDLTSEVFLGAFRGIGTFSGGEDQFRAWLFTIAHRRTLDEYRRTAARPRMATGDWDVSDRPGGDVEHDALRRLSQGKVQELCDRLAPDQRDVLLLRLVADLTVEQVAESLGKTAGAVKALQRRGLSALREIFQREGVPL